MKAGAASRSAAAALAFAFVLPGPGPAAAQEEARPDDGGDPAPSWVWHEGEPPLAHYVFLRREFFLSEVPDSAELLATGDDSYEVHINGTLAGKADDWATMDRFTIGPYLRPGKNVIGFRAKNDAGPGGLVAEVRWPGGRLVTDGSWRTDSAPNWKWQWETVGYDDSRWKPAAVLGALGEAEPWGGRVAPPEVTAERDRDAREGLRDWSEFELRDGDRVVFLGGTLVERAIRYGFLETALTAGSAAEGVTFRNLGWSGDDVLGTSRGRFGFQPEGFRHLKQHVEDLEPTVLVVAYGANESFGGQAGLAAFRDNTDALLDVLEATGARTVIVSPPKQEALGGKLPDPAAHNRDLALYADALRDAADRRGHWFLDLYRLLPVRGSADSAEPPLTDNSIHLTAEGYRKLAEVTCREMGVPVPDWGAVERLRTLVVEKNALYFHRWRPQNETYLTLFRKHEQGNNYREVPMFDPLVEALEEEIAAERLNPQRP